MADRCKRGGNSEGYSVVLRFILVLVLAVLVRGARVTSRIRERVSAPVLRFGKDGTFKIVQVADMHYADGATTSCQDVLPEQYATCSDLNTTIFLNRVIAEEKPDLLLFSGDNIMQEDCKDPIASMNMAFGPAIEAGIPWAAVLGNHDQEGNMSRERVMSYIASMDYSVSTVNPSGDTCSGIDGFGNFVLEVFGAAGSPQAHKSVMNLYLVDSGDYSTLSPKIRGYGWIHETQSTWIKKMSKKLQLAYLNDAPAQPQPAPSLAYFHIPLPEYSNLAPGQFKGVKQEGISSAQINSGFLTTLLEGGDVKAIFVGHDHVNDFCGDVHGLKLCYAGGFGYHAYGKAGWDRRTRVVSAALSKDEHSEWQGVRSIVTWKRLDNAKFDMIDAESVWGQDSNSVQ
ncbi:probable inactive purple acid phosphatase 29 [Physcomitrium patens]|uniref:Calcineurin-like phosphoesterase domain-containing protein n=1 Tax=Physcomitrium patens TaxID=3218 RepID=A0A2K1KD20_PHYPA|nr:probable inactive purple acid phosphatase 29 [Physcomitrium patens]PNR51676.1 hypothetical protein PHYPA_010864 [Physcomitrium patens]|eukprot:XP_024380925.1 probable inactive purple acid phosphatase 29 [Physcomitrella patens]